MIDVHCHLLPALDDGAPDLPSALAMAQQASAAGVTAILCTVHHLNGVYDNPRGDILAALATFQGHLDTLDIPLTLYPGAELHLVPELPAQLEDGLALTCNDQHQAALVELPKQDLPLGAEAILEDILYAGITPIIAHPERNQVLLRHPERLADWVQWGCKVQLTAQSCTGEFGPLRQQVSRQWLTQGLVHLVASDAHRPRGRSPASLARGQRQLTDWLGVEAAALLTAENPRRLLEGAPLQSLPAPLGTPARRPWWHWRRR